MITLNNLRKLIQKTLLLTVCCLQYSVFSFQFSTSYAQTGSWRAYMAYNEVQQIVKGGERLYVRASNGLYSYNLNDATLQTYDKIRQLSDTYIEMIAWNPTVQKLLILCAHLHLLQGIFQYFDFSCAALIHCRTSDKIKVFRQRKVFQDLF